jgi:hypothetical protein
MQNDGDFMQVILKYTQIRYSLHSCNVFSVAYTYKHASERELAN